MVLDGAPGHPSLKDVLTAGHPAPEVHLDPATHIAALPFSSGTSGKPKGVMLTHRNLVANVQQSRALLEVDRDDVLLALLPFFHIYGMTVLLNLALAERAQLVTMPKFDLTEFLRIIQEHRVTYLFIAPPVAVALAKHPLVADYDLSSVHTALSGAAPLDEELGHAVAERLGCTMLQGYGMSEMSPVSHLIPRSSEGVPLGSCGYTVPNMDIRIVDLATGEDIDPPAEGVSEPGHLLCRGPNVMVGYLNLPEATAETLDADGFLHTGDIATVSSTGVSASSTGSRSSSSTRAIRSRRPSWKPCCSRTPRSPTSQWSAPTTRTTRRCPRRSSCGSPVRSSTPPRSWSSWRPTSPRTRRYGRSSSWTPSRSRRRARSCGASCARPEGDSGDPALNSLERG